MRLILASASPRRAELLQSAGFAFEVEPADIDEVPADGEAPDVYTLRVAREKAQQVAARHRGSDVVVLGADTEVAMDRRIFGKPVDGLDARRMLGTLSGQEHWVHTGVVLIGPTRRVEEVVSTLVSFAPLTAEEIDWYVAGGEPMGKAGAYAIQGLGARFIERIEGSWSNVVGLPVATIHRLLGEVQ
jgi:septum formation protein